MCVCVIACVRVCVCTYSYLAWKNPQVLICHKTQPVI